MQIASESPKEVTSGACKSKLTSFNRNSPCLQAVGARDALKLESREISQQVAVQAVSRVARSTPQDLGLN